MGAQQPVEAVGEEWWQGDVADGGGCLGWPEVAVAADFVQGAGVATDVDVGVVEVGVGAGEAGEFTEAHAGVRGGEDQGPGV